MGIIWMGSWILLRCLGILEVGGKDVYKILLDVFVVNQGFYFQRKSGNNSKYAT